VPQKALDIPIGKIVAAKKRVGATVEDDEYNNKLKSKIVGTFSEADWKSRGATIGVTPDEISGEEEDVKEALAASDDDEDMDEIDLDDI
jgi:hypothetical protein